MLAYTLRMTPSGTFLDALRLPIRTLPFYNSGLSLHSTFLSALMKESAHV
jgi:hypothetical protein